MPFYARPLQLLRRGVACVPNLGGTACRIESVGGLCGVCSPPAFDATISETIAITKATRVISNIP